MVRITSCVGRFSSSKDAACNPERAKKWQQINRLNIKLRLTAAVVVVTSLLVAGSGTTGAAVYVCGSEQNIRNTIDIRSYSRRKKVSFSYFFGAIKVRVNDEINSVVLHSSSNKTLNKDRHCRYGLSYQYTRCITRQAIITFQKH